MKRFQAGASSFALMLATAAAPPPADDSSADIVVIGFSKPYKLSVKELRDAVAAYREGRVLLAPASELFFEVSSQNSADLVDLSLTLRSPGAVIPVTLDEHHRFVLPGLDGDDWELIANRARGALSIRPLVLSPGTETGDRRFGDMRLQCRVTWAIEKEHASIMVRGMFGMAGGCASTKLGLYAKSERPIDEATIADGTRIVPISVLSDRHMYRVPLGDKSLPNDARVRFTFQ
jgi:hypothetical protein